MFLGTLTVSVVLRGRQHPSWLTAALLVIFWPGSTLSRFWKTESSRGNCSICQSDQLIPRGHSTRWLYIFGLFWAVVAGTCNTTPQRMSFLLVPLQQFGFFHHCFPYPRLDVFSHTASLWSPCGWWGELRVGTAGCVPATKSRAQVWPEESRHGLEWYISCLVAAVSARKPVPGQTLGLMIFLGGTVLKRFFSFFWATLVLLLILSYCLWPQSHAIATTLLLKLLTWS